jgi:integrase
MSERILIHRIDLIGRKESIKKWKLIESEKKYLYRFLEELELGRVNKGKKICHSRICKYIESLKVMLCFFNKDLKKLNLKDVEGLERAFTLGTIKSNKEKLYAHNTLVDLRRILKIYTKWRVGAIKAEKLVGWLDTRDKIVTPDYLSEQQIESLYKHCKSHHERYLVAVLFDSGARATEFHNIRYEDVKLPDPKDNYVKINLKEEYSKTKGRNISLYWKHSSEAVKDYLQERIREGIKPDDPVYNYTYDSAKNFLMRLGKKVLGRRIYLHLFRHSSATYYASKLNRQQICYRYGWKFSSDMPDIYISRAGMNDKELDQQFTSSSVEELKAMLEKQMMTNKLFNERQEEMQRELEQRRQLDPLLNQLLDSPQIKQKLKMLGG